MTLDWVKGNIQRLFREGGPTDKALAQKLAKALSEGRLKGKVYSTPIKNGVPQETKIEDKIYERAKLILTP